MENEIQKVKGDARTLPEIVAEVQVRDAVD